MDVILRNVEPDDLDLAIRAAKRFLTEDPTRKDTIIGYRTDDSADFAALFYLARNKASITVRKMPK